MCPLFPQQKQMHTFRSTSCSSSLICYFAFHSSLSSRLLPPEVPPLAQTSSGDTNVKTKRVKKKVNVSDLTSRKITAFQHPTILQRLRLFSCLPTYKQPHTASCLSLLSASSTAALFLKKKAAEIWQESSLLILKRSLNMRSG